MKLEESEPHKFVETQKQDKVDKPEPGLNEEQVETLKQVSSLVAMFQQEALSEKQTRLLAQLKAIEKDRLASDAWKIIAALKKEKGDLENQVERLKAQNTKLVCERVGPLGGSKRSQVKPCETRQTENKLPDTVNKNNRIKDELNKLFVKDTATLREKDKSEVLSEKQIKGTSAGKTMDKKNDVDTTAFVSSNIQESTEVTDTKTQDVTRKKNLTDKSPVTIEVAECQDAVAGVCGLDNLGNTCFVNAGLQCLFNITPFCRFFLGGGHQTVTQKHPRNGQRLSKSLGELVTKVWSGSYFKCDPTELYTAVTTHFHTHITPHRQHDCHEFLALFLDGLHQELNCAHSDSSPAVQFNKSNCAEQSWRQYTKCNDSLIVDTFQGQLQSKITCSNCGHESFKYQPFTFLSVPLLSESYHTFVVTWICRDPSDGKIQSVRYKVQVTKPSTVLKLKTNFVSLLADDARPQVKDIKVSVVRNSQIISIMSNGKQLTPFTDRRSKLYIFKPSQAPQSMYVEDSNKTRRTSLLCPASQANNTTMYYSPEAASTTDFMSALDDTHSEGKSPVNKRHINRLTSPNTSTPKTHAAGQRTRSSLSRVYRLSGMCCICLEEKSDNELIAHDKCGRLFCRRCLQDASGGVIENQLCCLRCANQEAVIQSHEMEHKSRMVIIPVVLRRFEEDSKTKRLFGHPNLLILPTNILGRDLTSFITQLLAEPVCSLDFTLHLVDQQGLHCSRCTKFTGCTGCQVNSDVIINLQSCDNLAVQLTNISRWEAERMSRCVEHDSMWKPRNTEDPLQLEKCLNTFVESEELPDTWYCQKCREERNARKCLSLCRLPDTLIIHLKRYSQSGVKITAPVEFPVDELDMREYTKLQHTSTDQELGAGEFIYDLTGCVCHQGSYSSGHYTAYTNSNGVWYRYDDSQVTKEMPSNKCCSQAYILFYRRRAVSPLNTSISESQNTSKDKCIPLSQGSESTETEGDVPSPKLSQASFTEQKTLKEIGEELTQKLSMLQPAADRVCHNNITNNSPVINQAKRRKWKTMQKTSGKIKATEKTNQATVRPEVICEEGKVNTCDCKQCECLKMLEMKIRKAKHSPDRQSALQGVLETVKRDNMTRKHCGDLSRSVSKRSSLTSVSLSIHSSVSPSTTQSSTSIQSAEHHDTHDTAVQVTISDHHENQSPNTKQLHKSGDDSSLDDVTTLSHKLRTAIENENIRGAVTLLRRGADPNVLVNGLGALHTAVGLDSPLSLRFTRLLLDYGGDPDVPSADGLTPIHVAAMWNRVNCLKLLIDRGGNPYRQDKHGMNAIKLAKAFEADTSADTSDFLAKLDDRISKQLQQSSFQTVSLDSLSGDELSPPYQPSYSPSPHVGCGRPMKGLGKRVSMRIVGRKVSRNLRRASGQFRRGIRQIRSFLSSSSGSDKRIKN